ncbi:MAG TPA: SRPBCC domain-containing protein [Allosphingosinicella sp.]|nr:SRPBCC domain-containing protein [Allosphingosinicella sp.]
MPSQGRTDAASRLLAASPDAVFAALVDPGALMAWLPPDGMSGRALLFEPREGGRYRIELRYQDAAAPGATGKTTARTDVTSGRFLALEPGKRVVQSVEFESGDPAFAGEMIMTWSLDPAPGGTRVTVTAANVPAGISAEDHAAGLASSLENLARFLA